jgi:hypothetical protein
MSSLLAKNIQSVLVTNMTTSSTLTASMISTSNIISANATIPTILMTGSLLATHTTNTIGNMFTFSGNTGIGTTSPGSSLHVAGSMGIDLNTYASIQLNSTIGSYIDFATGGTDYSTRIISYSTGNLCISNLPNTCNLGINNSNPSYNLDVNGTGRFTGKLTITGTSGLIGFDTATNNQIAEMRIIRNGTSSADKDLFLQYEAGATSTLHMFSDNSETMTLKAGKVGINNASPNAPLQLSNALGNRKLVLFDATNNDHQYYGLGVNDSSFRYQVDVAGSSHDFYAGTSTTTSRHLMRIKGDGNIGIGTTSPTHALHVKTSNADDTVTIENTNAVGYATVQYKTNSLSYFSGVGGSSAGILSDKFYILNLTNPSAFIMGSTGNIGMSTNTPAYTLDVAGTIRASGTLIATTSITSGLLSATNIVGNSISAGTIIATGLSSLQNITATSIRLDAATVSDILTPSQTDAGNLTQTYIAFGQAGTSNDSAYLRQIGGSNSYKMALDIHDDGDEPGFCIRSVKSTDTPDTINERFTVQASGNVGIGTASPAYLLDVNGTIDALTVTTGNLSTGTSTIGTLLNTTLINYGLSAQWVINGGGNVTWSGTNLLWNTRVLIIPTKRSEYGSVGYFEINCPTSGTITYYNTSNVTTTVTCTGTGIPMNSFEALYYEITPGQTNINDATKLRLVNFNNTTWKPTSNWMLIAVVGDSSLKWIPGNTYIPTGKIFYSDSTNNWQINGTTNYIPKFNAANTLTSNSIMFDNGSAIGIGTSTPTTAFGGTVTNTRLTLKNSSNTSVLLIGGGDNHYSYIEGSHIGGGATYLSLGTCNAAVNPTEKMRITATGDIGIGTPTPTYKLDIKGNRLNLHNVGTSGGENLFEGLENATSRAQIVLSSMYSDMVIASSQANDNHGSTLTFASYNPSNKADYRKWVVNQGNWGARVHMLEFGYSSTIYANPHEYISDTNTLLTLDGSNKLIGIGTRNPTYKLDVNGSGRFTEGLTIATGQPGVFTNRTITSNTNFGLIYCADRPAAGNLGSHYFCNSNATTSYVSMNTPSYTLDVNGNCKVTNELYVGNAGGVGTIYMGGGCAGDADYNMSVIETRLYAGSESSEMLLFKGNDIAGISGPDRIRLRAGAIAFDTFNAATTTRTTESIRMYINESGNVGIGTVTPGYKLEVSGAIYASGEISAFSDKRLKTDIVTIPNSLDKVKQLRGVYYTHTQTQKRGLGVIAQEIQEILPEVVATDGEYLGVAYGNIVGVLIEAVKELESQNTQLKSQIQTILQHLNL